MALNNQVLNTALCYETFKNSVLKYANTGELDVIPVNYERFIRPNVKTGQIISQPMIKVYKPYVGKGIVGKNYFVRDFGYTN